MGTNKLWVACCLVLFAIVEVQSNDVVYVIDIRGNIYIYLQGCELRLYHDRGIRKVYFSVISQISRLNNSWLPLS